MKPTDPVREFLQSRGCPDHIVRGSLEGLLEKWELVVNQVARTYPLGIEDYLNDMDLRQILEEAFAVEGAKHPPEFAMRMKRADESLQTLLVPSRRCLWGPNVARENGWTAEKNWWYFNQPKSPGEQLARDLR